MKEFEKVILFYFVDEMEKTGATYKTIHRSFTVDELKLINEKYSIIMSLNEMEQTLNKLLANEYIKHLSLGGKFQNVGITLKGVGIVNSLRKKEEQRQNRTIIKKFSDMIIEHQGIMAVLGATLVIIGFVLRYKGII